MHQDVYSTIPLLPLNEDFAVLKNRNISRCSILLAGALRHLHQRAAKKKNLSSLFHSCSPWSVCFFLRLLGHDIQSIKIQQTSLEFKYNIALFCHYLSIKPFHLSKHISRDDLRQQHYLLKVVLLESLTNSGYLSLSKSLKIYVEAYQLQEVQRRFMALLD